MTQEKRILELQSSAHKIFEKKEILLSETAKAFIDFIAEAVIHDPPKPKNSDDSDEEFDLASLDWIKIGKRIIEKATKDRRIQRDLEDQGEVSFSALFRAISEASHVVLVGIGFKPRSREEGVAHTSDYEDE